MRGLPTGIRRRSTHYALAVVLVVVAGCSAGSQSEQVTDGKVGSASEACLNEFGLDAQTCGRSITAAEVTVTRGECADGTFLLMVRHVSREVANGASRFPLLDAMLGVRCDAPDALNID